MKRRAKFNRRYATGGIGGIVIRGLKPTAKFICRYAAKMRLQPTTNGPHPRVSVPRPMFPPHGLWVSALRPRVSVPRRRYPKIRIVVCGQSRHRRVEIPSRRVATIEFSRGFQPTDRDAPDAPVASATVEFSPAFQRRGMGFNPRIAVEYHQTTRASPTHRNVGVTVRIHNGLAFTVEFTRR